MRCPNCGTEASGSVCPLCGASLGAAETNGMQVEGGADSGFKLSGMNMNAAAPGATGPDAQPVDDYSDFDNQPYQYNADNMQAPKKKSAAGVIIGVIVAVVVIAAALVWFFVFREDGAKKSEELIKTYMEAIAAGDTDAIVSVVDPDCVEGGEVEELTAAFSMLASLGIEYTIDYDITNTEKASEGTIKNMCGSLYNDTSVAKDIKMAYICSVDCTMTMSYMGETETQDEDMDLICYKKDGEWYIGGYME